MRAVLKRPCLFADPGRSFNITLTERGMRGLRLLKRTNLDKRIIASGIKCYGRRVHKHPSEQSNQACCGPTKGTFYTPYGTNLDGNDFLLSIGRIALNKLLLKELVENKNITVHFGHKLKAVNLKAGSLSFETQDGGMLEASASAILGTDGCWSTVRQQMMRQTAARDISEIVTFHSVSVISLPVLYLRYIYIPPTHDAPFFTG
jgi:kynurenine 3-monooxygenase